MSGIVRYIHAPFGLFYWGTGPVTRYLFIVLMGILSAVLSLVLFKHLSRQDRLKRLRKRIWGTILQLHIYPDRIGILFGSLCSVTADTIRSLAEAVMPLAVISIPIMTIMLAIDSRCGYEALMVGEIFTISAHAVPGTALEELSIETSPGIDLETAALHIPDERLVIWRARITESAGQDTEFVRIKGKSGAAAEKMIAVNDRPRLFAPQIVRWSFPAGLLHSAEEYLSATGPVSSIAVAYPRASYMFFGWHVDAIVLYVMMTLIAGLILKPLIRVAL